MTNYPPRESESQIEPGESLHIDGCDLPGDHIGPCGHDGYFLVPLGDARLASEDAREQFARCIRDTAEPQAALPEPPVGPVMCPHGLYDWMCRKCKDASGGDPVEVHPSDSRAESQAGLNGPSGSPTSPPEPVPSAALPEPPEWAATITVPASYVHAIEAALAEGVSALARAERERDEALKLAEQSWNAARAKAQRDWQSKVDEKLPAAEEQVAALRAALTGVIRSEGHDEARNIARAALGGATQSGGSGA